MSHLPLPLRLALHALAASLVLTWAVAPEDPTALFRTLVPAILGALCAPLAVPAWRARWRAALRRPLRTADFVVFNAACLLLLLEGGLRLAGRWNDSPLLVPPNANAQERIRTYRGKPGSLRHGFPLNARGLHDIEVAEPRAPGVRRVVALGDSFGFGLVPYADNFLTLLDELLDAQGETEVVNYSIPAIGPEDYLHLYRTEARLLEPDLVLVCLYVGNDIRNPRPASLLHRESLMTFTLVHRLLALRHAPGASARVYDGVPDLDEAGYLGVETAQLDICEQPLTERTEAQYRGTERVLEEFRRDVGSGLRVVLIPDAWQVDDALWARTTARRGGRYDRDLPQRRLAAFLGARGVPCLDLAPALRAAQAVAPVYRHNDTHWDVHGNHAAADAIAEWMTGA